MSTGISSCNTFGATFFTDGYIDGQMYDSGAALKICPICKVAFWQKDVRATKNIFDCEYSHYSETLKVPFVGKPSISDFPGLINKKLWRTDDEEKYVRVRAWWAWNNRLRTDSRIDEKLPEKIVSDFDHLCDHLIKPRISKKEKYDAIRSWWVWDEVFYKDKKLSGRFADVLEHGSFEQLMQISKGVGDNANDSYERFKANWAWNDVYSKEPIIKGNLPIPVSTELEQILRLIENKDVDEKYELIREWRSWSELHFQIKGKRAGQSPLTKNLERLLDILDDSSESDALMQGEILRELGSFQECEIQLSRKFSDRYLKTANYIKELARQRKRCVARIM